MAFHFIAMLSDFSGGRRFGWHYSSEGKLDTKKIELFMRRVKEECGDVQFGIHKLTTDDTSWGSVIEKDSFFADVIITDSIDDFIRVSSNDKQLKAYDVAKFLLSILPASHLQLQKLIYYVYSDFLLKTGEKLFKEPIVAYKYGPVVEDVFQRYRVHGSSLIDYQEDATFKLKTDEIALTSSLMKVLSSNHGVEVLKSIKETIQKYGALEAFELVEKTHKSGGPWDRVYEEGMNRIITDEYIKRYHRFVK